MPPVELEPVESKGLDAIGYEAATRTLWVRFVTGRLYRYLDVPDEVFAELRVAASKGRFFNESIRNDYVSVEAVE